MKLKFIHKRSQIIIQILKSQPQRAAHLVKNICKKKNIKIQ